MSKLLLYSNLSGKRTRYIISTILVDFLGFDIQFAETELEFLQSTSPKISYLPSALQGITNFYNSNILETSSIHTLRFPINYNPEDDSFPDDFDAFVFCFFMLSRAEEYHCSEKDRHGRFPSQFSLASKYNFLHFPIVDRIAKQINLSIIRAFPQLQQVKTKHHPILTFDIDIAYALKAKPFFRQVGGMANELFSLNFSKLRTRYSVLREKKKDPFDVYDELEQLFQETQIPMIFFFQVRSSGKYDKAANTQSKHFIALVKRLSSFATIGIHPSYSGGQNISQIIAEKKILENIIGKSITHSRQHFLKFHLPQTAQALSEAGITHDYSMGYADQTGWRAGTCHPFNIYDIQNDTILPLITHPISVMDGTLGEYLSLQPHTALEEIIKIIKMTVQYNGTFIPLWHNETISDLGKWKGWKSGVFDPMIEYIKQPQR